MDKRLFILICTLASAMYGNARDTYNFNAGWLMGKQKQRVTLPRAWNEEEAFRVSTNETSVGEVWYRKKFRLPSDAQGRKVFIEFEGARQAAEVFLNGHRLGISENGIMAFGFDLTPHIVKGDNLIEVRTDNDWDYREKQSNSKFQWQSKSFNVNYGGLPKNVRLHICDKVYQTLPIFSNLGTTGTYVYGEDYDVSGRKATVCAESQVKNENGKDINVGYAVTVEDRTERWWHALRAKTRRLPPEAQPRCLHASA